MENSKNLSNFQYHTDYFKEIPLEKRYDWIQEMFITKQIDEEPQKLFLAIHDQPTNPFQYKEWTLNYHKVESVTDPKAILFWFHGLNGHGGNYAYISTTLAKQLNINVYLLDLMNFGQSQGYSRGCIRSFQECLDQAEKFTEFILSKYEKVKPKVFLGGNSFGGTMCFHMTLRKPNFFQGVLLTAPGLRDLPNQQIMKTCAKIFGYFFPKMRTFKSQYININKYCCRRLFKEDQHNYLDGLIPGTFRVAMTALDDTSNKFHKFSAPYILFQGGVDKVVDPFAPVDLERQCKSTDKTTIYFKDMWHSIPFEEEIEVIVKMMTHWLKQRI